MDFDPHATGLNFGQHRSMLDEPFSKPGDVLASRGPSPSADPGAGEGNIIGGSLLIGAGIAFVSLRAARG